METCLSLLGVMEEREARGHAREMAGGAYAEEAIHALWTTSRQSFKPIPKAGLPSITELPASAREHLLTLAKRQDLRAMTGGFLWSARLVEVAPLLSLAVDLYERKLAEWVDRLGTSDQKALLDACLPLKADPLNVAISSPTQANIVHADLGADLRLDPSAGLGVSAVQPPLCVRIGAVQGRYCLFDGYHRAAALTKLGHTHVPALILHDATWAFLRGTPRDRRFEVATLNRAEPPCLGHFGSEAAVQIPALRRVKVMTMRVESFISVLSE